MKLLLLALIVTATTHAQAQTQVAATGFAEAFEVTPGPLAAQLRTDAENNALANAKALCGSDATLASDFTYTFTHGCAQYLGVHAMATFNCN